MTKLLNIALLSCLACSVLAQVDPNRVVAIVNGQEIKGDEYYHRMEFLPGVGKQMDSGFVTAAPGFLTIEQLITEKLVLQLAQQKGVYPTDLEVDAELKNRQQDTPKLVEDWTALGHSMEDLRNGIRFDLAEFKLETYGITVTDQEVEQFYNQNPTMYTEPKKVKLRVVVVQDDAGKTAVDQALAAGKPFNEVAQQYSIDVTKSAGGEYGVVPLSYLADSVRTAISEIKLGGTTDWLSTTPNGNNSNIAYLKFQKVDVIPEQKVPLDDRLRRSIRKRLMTDRGHVKNDVRKEMLAMRANAKVQINQPELDTEYKKFNAALLKQAGQ